MLEKIKKLKEECLNEIKSSHLINKLNEIRVKYLGKQGEITNILKSLKDVPASDKPIVGSLVNETKNILENEIKEKINCLNEQELNEKLLKEKIDITEQTNADLGSIHPLNLTFKELINKCIEMGYEVVLGPEVETDYYNFQALNVPKNHPARDMQDTFYVDENITLRSQTSSVQARIMELKKPPFKIISPGRVYRSDCDATHTPVFHQLEGLVIDENVSLKDLKSQLTILLKSFFGEETVVRFRPSFFPFTEPSVEVDISCPYCGGKSCKMCKGTGFIEILGAGIVNPKVLECAGIDSNKYSGFAFGFGVDRFAMVKYSVPDLRMMFENDVRFLKQFNK